MLTFVGPTYSLGVFIFAGFFLLTWLILMPVVGTSDGGGTGVRSFRIAPIASRTDLIVSLSQLNRFTFGNVGLDQQPRIIAHYLVAIVLTRACRPSCIPRDRDGGATSANHNLPVAMQFGSSTLSTSSTSTTASCASNGSRPKRAPDFRRRAPS